MAAKSSSGDEVRRKPVSSPQPPPTVSAAGNDLDSFDILVLGRTGTGKSSTVEKLLVPNTRDTTPQAQHRPTDTDKQPIMFNPRQKRPEARPEARLEAGLEEIDVDRHRDKLQCENLTAWVLSDNEEEHENADLRLKNIVFCRDTPKSGLPHTQINCYRNPQADTDDTGDNKDPNTDDIDDDKDEEDLGAYSSSKSCELLMNDDTNIRIVDTPGFYSPNTGAKDTEASNLGIVRQIIYIQATVGLKFRRILYFLPSGPLKRSDRVIQQEIRCILKFFNSSIFTRMVLVATIPHFSTIKDMTEEKKFPDDDLETNRALFYQALLREYKERNKGSTKQKPTERPPMPPIIYIAMTDTCEKILEKVMSAPVVRDEGLEVQFQSNTCVRCNAEIGYVDGENLVCTYRYGNGQVNIIPYKETTCHPSIKPRITARSFFRGLGGLFLLRWHFSEDLCTNPECKKAQGSQGCKKVFSEYNGKTVDHTDQLDYKPGKDDTSMQEQ